MKNIYVFSGNQEIYNTTIRDEINNLKKYFNVITIIEDEGVYSNTPVNKNIIKAFDVNHKLNIKYINFIVGLYLYTRDLKFFFKIKRPDAVIFHAEDEIKTIIAGRLAKNNNNNVKIIRRVPTKILSPQNDYLWLRRQRGLLYALFVKIIKYYLLVPICTGKIYKSRQKWVLSAGKMINNKASTEVDISLCYSLSCKKILSSLGENAKLIDTSCKTIKKTMSKANVALYVPSKDWELIREIKGCTIEEALEFEYSVFKRIQNTLSIHGVLLEAKFRDDISQGYFQKLEPNLNIIDCKKDIYQYINEYSYIIGYCSTVLMKQSLYNQNQKIISIQLEKHDFYYGYKNDPLIYYIENESLEQQLDKILKEKFKNKKQAAKFNIAKFMQEYLSK